MVINTQLRSARESLRLNTDEVAAALNLSEDQIKEWENGQAIPTIEQLWRLADFYSRDVDYFLTDALPIPVELNFRFTEPQHLERLSIEIRRLITRFDELCRAQMELEETLNKPRKIEIIKATDNITPEEVARRERVRIGQYEKPIKDVRSILEKQGIRVFELDIPDNIFSGLSWWHQNYGPCVLVNYSDVKGRKNFTLSHEYCHLLLDHGPLLCEIEFDYGKSKDEERIADRFAATFLMPSDDLVREFRSRQLDYALTDKQLGNLASRYGTSLEAMGRRLEEMSLVNRGFVDERLETWKNRRKYWGHTGKRRPKWQNQLGITFVNDALRAHSSGQISLATLSHYFGIDMREAYKMIHEK